MPSQYKLKRVRVRVNRTLLREREAAQIRDQLLFRRCAVRLQRYNPDQLSHLASNSGTTEVGVVDENMRAYKLRRLCVRIPRLWTQMTNIPSVAGSDISSRASPDPEGETIVPLKANALNIDWDSL
uniref:Uncharacterized protein n=1 Tax=Glossina brevipalpis TaxID=37001 RepID=A0A1A9WK44_9MUSC